VAGCCLLWGSWLRVLNLVRVIILSVARVVVWHKLGHLHSELNLFPFYRCIGRSRHSESASFHAQDITNISSTTSDTPVKRN
jgi:hypothetical protein